jgi:tRNA(Phe) wybutosine-synthesizing methylase Tyw3
LNSSDRLEFPIIRKGKILVDDVFLKLIVKSSNEKLEKGWEKIKKLEKIV